MKRQIIGNLAIANAKETIIVDIQKDGILTDLCHSCITHLLTEVMQSVVKE